MSAPAAVFRDADRVTVTLAGGQPPDSLDAALTNAAMAGRLAIFLPADQQAGYTDQWEAHAAWWWQR